MESKKSVFGIVRDLLIVVFAVVFAVSGVMLVLNLVERRKGTEMYASLEETFYKSGFDHEKLTQSLAINKVIEPMEPLNELDAESVEDTTEQDSLNKTREGFIALREINPDIYAWIFVPGTDIDYPVVRGDDNMYYLNHAYDRAESSVGSIFADFRCHDVIGESCNTVFYGHNLLTGGADMFHDVELFLEREFFDSALIYVYTFDGIYVYKPFSVYQARHDYNYFRVNFDSQEEFVDFSLGVKENSRFDTDTTFEAGDSILTLSTCTNIEYFTRYVLHAKLIYRIEE